MLNLNPVPSQMAKETPKIPLDGWKFLADVCEKMYHFQGKPSLMPVFACGAIKVAADFSKGRAFSIVAVFQPLTG
jgi:hypothetical protein